MTWSPIPIYDDTVPIACTAGRDETANYIEVVERTRSNLHHVDRTEHGLLLHFPLRPDIEADVRQFAIDEKRCCQFWGFQIETIGDALTLRWDGPPDANDILNRLHDAFESDVPIASVSGLL